MATRVSQEYYDAEDMPQYFLPDFFPQGARLENVQAVLDKPTSGAKSRAYVKQILSEVPYQLNDEVIDDLVDHACRHGLPDIAQRSMLSMARRASVGLWAGGNDEAEEGARRRKMAMPLLYASEKRNWGSRNQD